MILGFDFGTWIQTHITPELIATIISVMGTIAVVLRLAVALRDLAKKHTLTMDELLSKLKEEVNSSTDESVEKIVEPLKSTIYEIKPYLVIFAKILALSQENTAQSRLAILELIEQLGSVDSQTTEEAKQAVIDETTEDEEKKQEQIEALETIATKNTTPVD